MKSEKHEELDYDWYGFSDNWHRINGPVYIEYETSKKKEICLIAYYLYDERFFPWWLNHET